MSTLTYLRNFIKDKNVASVTPTSSFGVRRICRKIDFSKSVVIIEYGPGTGVISRALLEKMTADSRLILIEINREFVHELNKIDDRRLQVVEGDVQHIRTILDEAGVGQVDYIISGIPFSFIDAGTKNKILEVSRDVLKPDGKFLAYQTSKHLLPYLSSYFPYVATEYEWLNIPPLCCYEARKQNRNGIIPESN